MKKIILVFALLSASILNIAAQSKIYSVDTNTFTSKYNSKFSRNNKKSMIGVPNIDNASDIAKPLSPASVIALGGKIDFIVSPTFLVILT